MLIWSTFPLALSIAAVIPDSAEPDRCVYADWYGEAGGLKRRDVFLERADRRAAGGDVAGQGLEVVTEGACCVVLDAALCGVVDVVGEVVAVSFTGRVRADRGCLLLRGEVGIRLLDIVGEPGEVSGEENFWMTAKASWPSCSARALAASVDACSCCWRAAWFAASAWLPS